VSVEADRGALKGAKSRGHAGEPRVSEDRVHVHFASLARTPPATRAGERANSIPGHRSPRKAFAALPTAREWV
jgi:hypothetical protein